MCQPASLDEPQQTDLPMQEPADAECGAEADPGLRIGDERLIRRPHAHHVDPSWIEAEGDADRDCQNQGASGFRMIRAKTRSNTMRSVPNTSSQTIAPRSSSVAT